MTKPYAIPIVQNNLQKRTFVLSVGTNGNNQTNKLKYTHKDAQDFYELVKEQELNDKHYSVILQDTQVSYESTLDAFQWLQTSTNDNDNIYIFLSGHGFIDPFTKKYSFLLSENNTTKETLTADVLINFISKISGNIVFFLDSCYSGNFNDYIFTNIPKFKAKSFYSFTSSLSGQPSYEHLEFKNSCFTSALIKTIRKNKRLLDITNTKQIHLYLSQELPLTCYGLQFSDYLKIN